MSSFNSIMAAASLDMKLQDDAANTTVVNDAGADGTLQGGDNTTTISTTGPGKGLSKALSLDGVADRIVVPSSTLYDEDDHAVVLWVKPSTLVDTYPMLFSRYTSDADRIEFFLDSVNSYEPEVGTTNSAHVEANTSVTQGEWQLVGFSRNGSDRTYYRNGAADGAATHVAASSAGAGEPISIGARENGDLPFHAAIAGVAYIPSEISAADHAQLYAGPELQPVADTASLDAQGNYDIGSFSLPSGYSGTNGTPSYEARLVSSAGAVLETVAASANTTGTFAAALAQGSTYYLEAKATNDGGVDIGDSPVGTSPDGWYRVGSLAVPTYEELGTDADLYDWLLLNDNAATDTYANSGSTGEDFVAYAGNSEDHHVAFDGSEPFDWLTGGWFKNSGTSLRLRNSGSARTGTTTALSVCTWIKTTDSDGMIWCIDDGGDIHARLDLDTNGKLRVVLGDNASPSTRKFWTSTATNFDDGTERFVGFAWSAASNTLAVYGDDGVVIPGTLSEDGAVASIGLDDWHVIGGVISNSASDAGFHHLGDLREYHRELSQAEMQVLSAGPAVSGDSAQQIHRAVSRSIHRPTHR